MDSCIETLKFKKFSNLKEINPNEKYWILVKPNDMDDSRTDGQTVLDIINKKKWTLLFPDGILGYMPISNAARKLLCSRTYVPPVIEAGTYVIWVNIDTNITSLKVVEIPEDTETDSIRYSSSSEIFSFDENWDRPLTCGFKVTIHAIHRIDVSKAYSRVNFIDKGLVCRDGYYDHPYKPLTRKEVFDAVKKAYSGWSHIDKQLIPSDTEVMKIINDFYKENPTPSGREARDMINERIANRKINLVMPFTLHKDGWSYSEVSEYLDHLNYPKSLSVQFRADAD